MKNKFVLSLFVLIISFSAFAQVKDVLPPSYRTDQSYKPDIFRAEDQKINSLVHTRLDMKFDYQNEEVNGEARITLKPHFYETDKLVIDAIAMLIHDVSLVKGNSMKKLNFKYDDFQIHIDLDKTYKRNEEYTIYIKYTARPNHVKQVGGAAVLDAKGIYFINPRGEEPDKPTQIWTQGEPDGSACWFPTIDSPNQKTSQEIYLTVEDKYLTLSNGELKKQTKNSDGTRTDYWDFKEKHAPYLFFVGVGEFSVVKDSWKGKEVSYYVEKEYEPYARDIFGDTPDMIEFYSNLLDYPYPWNKYAQMVGRDYISGAMENTTAVLHLERAQQKPGQLIDENIWEGTIAHELFHHWFGDLVTMESHANITVNESFANYSEYLWYEHKYGREKAEEDRYWDLESYKADPSNFDKNLVRYHYKTDHDLFDWVTYNKGGKGILHMLRNYLGDDAFFEGMSLYLKRNEYGTGEAVQLRLAWEEVSGKDLNWFFDQWYFGHGHPKLTITHDFDATTKKVKVNITQSQSNLFEFPFAIDIVVDGKVTGHDFWVSKKRNNSFEFDAAQKPETVILNSNQVLLCDITDNKTIAEIVAQYKYGKGEFTTRYLAIERLKDAQSTDEIALNTLADALNDPYEGIRIAAVRALDEKDSKVISKTTSVLKKLAGSDTKTMVQAAALNKLNDMGEKDISIFEKAISSPSFSVQAAAATGILRINPSKIEELSNLDDEVLEANESLITELLDYWIEKDDKSKLSVAADAVAFFLFTQFEDPVAGAKLEKGFKWVMGSDDLKSTQKIAKAYAQVFKYYGKDNPNLGMALRNLIDQGIDLKVKANRENPSQGYEDQIKILNDTKNKMK